MFVKKMPTMRICLTLDEDLIKALDDFRSDFARLTRSELVESMLFYCFGHDDVLEEISEFLESDEYPEEEEETAEEFEEEPEEELEEEEEE